MLKMKYMGQVFERMVHCYFILVTFKSVGEIFKRSVNRIFSEFKNMEDKINKFQTFKF